MIRAIIFDCFGVLTVDGWLRFRQDYIEQDEQLSMRATELNQMADRGEISFDTFLDEIARLTGVDGSIVREQVGIHPPDPNILEYVDSLRPQYKIGLLSNAAMDWTPELFTKTQLNLFEAIVLSCELGVLKPDPKMYITIADRLQVKPNECVYTDDRETSIEGGVAVGMQAILFKNLVQFKVELEQLLTASAK